MISLNRICIARKMRYVPGPCSSIHVPFSIIFMDCFFVIQIDAIIYRHHMVQQQLEQPVQQAPQMRQRYMRTRLQTSSMNGRSSSNSRNSDGNSREMDPMTRSENYKYVDHRSHIQIRSPESHNSILFHITLTVTLDLRRTLAPVIRVPNQCRLH